MTPRAKKLDITDALLAWPKAKEQLRLSLRHDGSEEQTLREIEAKVATGLHALWELKDEEKVIAYAVSILYTTSGQELVAQLHMATAGDLQLLLDQMPQFESWAIREGVDYIEVIGRKGWIRVLESHGFMLDHVSLMKRMTKGMH